MIRTIKNDEFDECVNLIYKTYLSIKDEDNAEGQAAFTKNLINFKNNKVDILAKMDCFGYFSSDKMIGVAIVDGNYLKYLFVDPDSQHLKIGKTLIGHVIKFIKTKGNSTKIVVDSSINALNFYKKCGFNQISDILKENEMKYIKMEYIIDFDNEK